MKDAGIWKNIWHSNLTKIDDHCVQVCLADPKWPGSIYVKLHSPGLKSYHALSRLWIITAVLLDVFTVFAFSCRIEGGAVHICMRLHDTLATAKENI